MKKHKYHIVRTVYTNRKLLAKQFQAESEIVREESMRILREFERLDKSGFNN